MKKAFFQLHMAIVLAACSSIFGKLISLNEVFITWYRMMFSSIILLLFLIISKNRLNLVKKDVNLFLTGMLLALHWVFFYGSIKYANISIGVICFCLSGFFTAILSPLITKKKISLIELLLSSITLIGISFIFHFDASFRLGIILGIISAFLFSLFAIVNEKVTQNNTILKATTLEMVGGTIGIAIMLPLYLHCFPEISIYPSLQDTGYLFFLALFCTVFMCFMLNNAQRKISAFTVSLSFNLEPIYSIFLAIILFQEDKQLNYSFYTGLSLIVLSLLLQMSRMILRK